MALDFIIERNRQAVDTAIMQFAARRSYRLTQPWYLDGVRIEATQAPMHSAPSSNLTDKMAGIWTALTEGDAKCPRIDVEVRDKRTRTKLKISVSDHPESVKLAYELHVYLMDNRAFSDQCPARCPKCGSPVPNVVARYCGRCGSQLTGNSLDTAPPPIPIPHNSLAMEDEAELSAKFRTASEVTIERDNKTTEQDPEDASVDQKIGDTPQHNTEIKQVEQEVNQTDPNGESPDSENTPLNAVETSNKPEAHDTTDAQPKISDRVERPKRRMLAED